MLSSSGSTANLGGRNFVAKVKWRFMYSADVEDEGVLRACVGYSSLRPFIFTLFIFTPDPDDVV